MAISELSVGDDENLPDYSFVANRSRSRHVFTRIPALSPQISLNTHTGYAAKEIGNNQGRNGIHGKLLIRICSDSVYSESSVV